MTLTSSKKLVPNPTDGDFSEVAAAETPGGEFGTDNVAVALPLEGVTTTPGADWTYSATAEGGTGETPVNGIDLDGQPGMIYSGPAGAAIRVEFKGLDVSEGTIAPEASDSVVAAIFKNNAIVAFAEEGFTNEIDTGTPVEFNGQAYVGGLQNGDVIRIGLVGGSEETADWDVAVGGSFVLV